MTDDSPATLTRRQMLSIAATAGAALAVAACSSPESTTATPTTTAIPTTTTPTTTAATEPMSATGSTQPGGPVGSTATCGGYNDTGKHLYLWEHVKDTTPAVPKTNIKVVLSPGGELMHPRQQQPKPTKAPAPPGDATQGWAIRWGGSGGKHVLNDRLFVPTQRVMGIECSVTWDPRTINYFKLAWAEAITTPPKGNTIAVGINSADKRTQDQLHIHLSFLQPLAVTDLATALANNEIAQSQASWSTKLTKINNRVCRVLPRPDLNQNIFALLQADIAKNNMHEQMLVVTSAPQGGFYVINSQASLPGGGGASCDPFLVYK